MREMTNSLVTLNAGGDGMTLGQEYLAGTNVGSRRCFKLESYQP